MKKLFSLTMLVAMLAVLVPVASAQGPDLSAFKEWLDTLSAEQTIALAEKVTPTIKAAYESGRMWIVYRVDQPTADSTIMPMVKIFEDPENWTALARARESSRQWALHEKWALAQRILLWYETHMAPRLGSLMPAAGAGGAATAGAASEGGTPSGTILVVPGVIFDPCWNGVLGYNGVCYKGTPRQD